VNQGW